MDQALEIVNRWTDLAHAAGLRAQWRGFWYIRDVLEGLRIGSDQLCYSFAILNQAKPSPEREVIIQALRAILRGT